MTYESMASSTLREVRSPAVAYALLCLMPWELATKKPLSDEEKQTGEGGSVRDHKRLVLMREASVLEEASSNDNMMSFPCREFISERHCQETLSRIFAGHHHTLRDTPRLTVTSVCR